MLSSLSFKAVPTIFRIMQSLDSVGKSSDVFSTFPARLLLFYVIGAFHDSRSTRLIDHAFVHPRLDVSRTMLTKNDRYRQARPDTCAGDAFLRKEMPSDAK